jgi:hypothetical protein
MADTDEFDDTMQLILAASGMILGNDSLLGVESTVYGLETQRNFHELTSKVRFELDLIGNFHAIYHLVPYFFLPIPWDGDDKVKARFSNYPPPRTGEEYWRYMKLAICVRSNHKASFDALETSGAIVDFVQATTYLREDNSILWKGQLKNAKVVDDDAFGDSPLGKYQQVGYLSIYRVYYMMYESVFTFVDTRAEK